MTQLVVNVEDASVIGDIKKAISMLKGVSKVTVCKNEAQKKTIQAIEEMKSGDTIKCISMEDYLEKVKE